MVKTCILWLYLSYNVHNWVYWLYLGYNGYIWDIQLEPLALEEWSHYHPARSCHGIPTTLQMARIRSMPKRQKYQI